MGSWPRPTRSKRCSTPWWRAIVDSIRDWATTVLRVTYRHPLRRLHPPGPAFFLFGMPHRDTLRAYDPFLGVDVTAASMTELEQRLWSQVQALPRPPADYGGITLDYLEHRSLDGSLPHLAGVRTPPGIVQLWPRPGRLPRRPGLP